MIFMNYSARKVELSYVTVGLKRAVKDTFQIYRAAVKRLCEIALEEWGSLADLSGKEQLTVMESFVHGTKNRQVKYPDFDRDFYKFPSYYRRSAIHAALGQVSSYLTRKEQYEETRKDSISNGKRFRQKAPALNLDTNCCPSMYKKAMYTMDGGEIWLKLRIRNTWDWVQVSAPNRDIQCLNRALKEGGTLSSPKLLMKNKKLYLQFPVSFPGCKFPEDEIATQKILGVDLGINRGAVCSVVDASGTIHGRYFDPFASERDRMNHMLNKLRKISRQSGKGQSLSAFYTKLDGMKENYVRQLARWIIDRARSAHVYGIAMEHLGRMKGRGNKKDRIHHWCKKRIFDFVKGMGLRYGIRVFCINPRNTSALAFDGSGKVKRDADNFSLCTFASGKRYDCDLSASYNIAARYFIRTFQKSIPETEWSQYVAKVPVLAKRTDCTLSTLWKLDQILHPAKAAA